VLQKETSLTYSDIFGREIKYVETIEDDRDNAVLNTFLGPKKTKVERVGRSPGMRAQALQQYIDLMKEHSERVERKRKKGKMRSKMRKSKFGNM